MLSLGLRIFRERREAEDVLHDVFVEAWRRVGDYDPRRGLVRTWLLLRMRSRCLDRVRSAGYSRGESLTDREETVLGRQAGLDDGVAAVEGSADRQRVRSVLASLPEGQRAVLELGYFLGLSSSEIAERLDIPIGTVKSRVRVALGKLREALGVEA
jgi:RNA polymerase sigma-70 factor (ECF subfamily)